MRGQEGLCRKPANWASRPGDRKGLGVGKEGLGAGWQALAIRCFGRESRVESLGARAKQKLPTAKDAEKRENAV